MKGLAAENTKNLQRMGVDAAKKAGGGILGGLLDGLKRK
jgi:hypothetical protein